MRGLPQGDEAVATVDVVGLASPGARVTVSSEDCAQPCAATATADGSGTWQATLAMALPADASQASVTAAYEAARPSDVPARVTVGVTVPDGARQAAVPDAPTADARPHDEAPAPEPEPLSPDEPAPSAPASDGGGGARTMVLVGDSLSVRMAPLLQAALPGWTIRSSARIGRPLAEGMRILADTSLPGRPVLAMGLFTNDDPGSTGALAAAVAESLRRAGPGGCAIWATIAAPPVRGRTFDAANRMLNELAAREPRLRVVQWAQAVALQPTLLAGDGVHPVATGEQVRAQLFALAARSCP